MITNEEIDARAAAGAAFLDQHWKPGWAGLIDKERLNQASCNDCVFGQIFGGYCEGQQQLNVYVKLDERDHVNDGVALGFTSSGEDHPGYFERLTAAWRLEVEKRTASAVTP